MKLEDIKSVLNFSAFRPDPDFSDAPIGRRFHNRRLLHINVSRGNVSWKVRDKRGRVSSGGSQSGELAEVTATMADEWRGLTDNGWVSISMNNRFVMTLESNLSRKPGSEQIVRDNPKSIIGARYDRGKRYGVFHNPETSASILLACDESNIKTIEDVFRDNGLKIARISCGLFNMVEDYLRRDQASSSKQRRDFLLIACCEGSVSVLVQKKGQWTELRSRSGLFSGSDTEPVMQIAAPLINASPQGSSILLLNDDPDSDFAIALRRRLEEHGAMEVTQPNQLWEALNNN